MYFTTPHFDGYPAILVRLDRISHEELEELIVEAWLARAPKRLAGTYLETHLQHRADWVPLERTRRGPPGGSG